MKTLVPDYYRDFRCKADMCRHSCCVGWEIDVDSDAEKMYGKVGDDTDFGRKLGKSISHDGTPHFILTEDERCPFLTKSGLCEIYINLGENASAKSARSTRDSAASSPTESKSDSECAVKRRRESCSRKDAA